MNTKLFDRYKQFSVKDKNRSITTFRDYMLNKTGQIFEYQGLPDSIPEYILELYLQTNGNVIFYEHEGTLYVFTGGLGGEPDVYYRPTLYTIANPALKISKNIKIDEEGVLMRNDTNMLGLLPLIYKWGTILTEAEISFNNAIIATRDFKAYSAKDDKTAESAREYQRQIEAGNTAIISEGPFLQNNLQSHPTQQNKTLADLRETYQYIKSLLYSDLGMKTAHNMKREYVSEEENIINDDTLIPLIDNMLENRQRALEKVNEMFGTEIQVKLRGTWELQAEELETALEMTKEGIALEGEGESGDNEEVESEEEIEDTGHEVLPEGEGETIDSEGTGETEEASETEEERGITINININGEEEDEES